MLFLMQSTARVANYPMAFPVNAQKIDDEDDDLFLLVWFTYMSRWYK